jgi:hypothetical protein
MYVCIGWGKKQKNYLTRRWDKCPEGGGGGGRRRKRGGGGLYFPLSNHP